MRELNNWLYWMGWSKRSSYRLLYWLSPKNIPNLFCQKSGWSWQMPKRSKWKKNIYRMPNESGMQLPAKHHTGIWTNVATGESTQYVLFFMCRFDSYFFWLYLSLQLFSLQTLEHESCRWVEAAMSHLWQCVSLQNQ